MKDNLFSAGWGCILTLVLKGRLRPKLLCKVAASIGFLINVSSMFGSSLTLTLACGTATSTLWDGGTGSIDLGFYFYGWNTLGGLYVSSQPLVGTASSNCLSVSIVGLENYAATAPLVITATETGLGPNPSANTFNMSLTSSGVGVIQTGMIDDTLMGSIGPTPGTGSISVSGPTNTFSMTETLEIPVDAPTESTTANLFLFSTPVPEPSILVIVGLGVTGLLASRKRNASASCYSRTLLHKSAP